ncbi:hypothetical protein KH5H1_71920 [Corallococcus caeni]|nr:hypothetical protein KH5H1_71920 [Corallococcus sp. KH5-1]
MTPAHLHKLDRELSEYLDSMIVGMGRTERRRALGGYVTGLLLDGERKSIEPMAARLAEAPDQTEALRKRLQQCVSGAAWDDAQMRCRLSQKLERELPGLEALLVDDTGFSEERPAFGGCRTPVLGNLGPYGQLPGGGESARGGREGQRLHWDAPVPPRGLDGGQTAHAGSRHPTGGPLRAQMGVGT